MRRHNIYIAEIHSIFPRSYASEYIADKMYPSQVFGNALNKLARKLARKFGIEYRTSVIDYELFPKIELADPADHPRLWGKEIIDTLTATIDKNEIGLFSLNYNVSYHSDTLPNLASQIIMDAELISLDRNEEIAHYGCAAGIYSLQQAFEYCKEYDRAAIVFSFDQCTVQCRQLEKEDPDFRKMLVSNLLFTDGGIGVLVIPERMRNCYKRPLPRISDCLTKYTPGKLICMKNDKFLMSDSLKDIMPKLVSNILVKPFLAKHYLAVKEIDEWSIHQGGSEVIKQFCRDDCLNLSEGQIERSLKLFYRYGNTSSASCLLVLDSFFNNYDTISTEGSKGLILGYGAGYYLGALLYEYA